MSDLTPSEVVLLNGERFATRRLTGNVRLLHVDRRVAARDLGRAILQAAFLANEESDVIRFHRDDLPRRFGRRPRPALFVERGRRDPEWPRHTVEWAVPAFLREFVDRRGAARVPVGAVVDSFFDGDRPDPWAYVVDLVKDGLAARGLLERRPQRWFRLDTGRVEYTLPESTARLAADSSPERVERMFAGTEYARPEVWELLTVAIERSVDARLETETSYSFEWSPGG